MYCDQCGLNFLPKQAMCTRCGAPPTRHWLQLMSLVTVMVAVAANSVVWVFVLPRLTSGPHSRFVFRAWMWMDVKISLYGWAVVALGLLAWDHFICARKREKIKRWVTRKLLTFALLAVVSPFIPWWVPAGQPPQSFLASMAGHPGLPALLAWGVVVFVLILLCANAETRDSLLGDGKTLSLVSVGALVVLLGMTIAGWALS